MSEWSWGHVSLSLRALFAGGVKISLGKWRAAVGKGSEQTLLCWLWKSPHQPCHGLCLSRCLPVHELL